jgi:hypothetical protein
MKGKTVFRIEIELGNDKLRNANDIYRKLTELRTKINALADSGEEKRILDDNGNAVGRWGFYHE